MKTEFLINSVELWDKFSSTADFESNGYDEELLCEIRKELGFEDNCDVRKEIVAQETTPEQLLAVLLKTMHPFSVMLKDLLKMFEAAGAQYTDDNIQIQFDFENAKDSFDITLEHFRAYKEKVETVFETQFLLEDCDPWTDFVNPVERILNSTDRYLFCDCPPLPAHITEWLQDYYDCESNWPDQFPPPPQSGVEKIDNIIAKVWQLPRAANELYRSCYIADLGPIKSLREMQEKSNSFFYGAEIDCWLARFVKLLCILAFQVNRLIKENCDDIIDSIEKQLYAFQDSLPIDKTEHEERVNEFLDLLNLPVWKKRHALYSAWVATQIVSASDKWTVDYHVENGVLSFSFGGSVIAHLKFLSLDIALIAELRTQYSKVVSKKRKNHIQPDYSLCIGDASNPHNTLLVVECKQYKKANKRNFLEAVTDYAGGRPNAQIILANYTSIPESFRSKLTSEVKERVPFFDILFPNGDGCDSFKKAIRNVFLKECTIALSWSAAPADLDLILEITDSEDKELSRIDYSNMGKCETRPFACLDKDDRNGFGHETIRALIAPTMKYKVLINNYSGEETSGVITVSIRIGMNKAVEVNRYSNLTKSNLWHVFDFDYFSIRQIDSE